MSVWTSAAIEPPAGHAWQRFTATWRPDHGGTHELSSRAQLADARRQPPSGARNAIYRVPVNVGWGVRVGALAENRTQLCATAMSLFGPEATCQPWQSMSAV